MEQQPTLNTISSINTVPNTPKLPLQITNTASSIISTPIPDKKFLSTTIPNTPIINSIDSAKANQFVYKLKTFIEVHTPSINNMMNKIPQVFSFPDTPSNPLQPESQDLWNPASLIFQAANAIVTTDSWYHMPNSPLHANRVASNLINIYASYKGFNYISIGMIAMLTSHTLYTEGFWSTIQQTTVSTLYMFLPTKILKNISPKIFKKIYKAEMTLFSAWNFFKNAYSWYQNNYGDQKETYKIDSYKSKSEFYETLAKKTNIKIFEEQTLYYKTLLSNNVNTEKNTNETRDIESPNQKNSTISVNENKTDIPNTNSLKDLLPSVIYNNAHLLPLVPIIPLLPMMMVMKYCTRPQEEEDHSSNYDNDSNDDGLDKPPISSINSLKTPQSVVLPNSNNIVYELHKEIHKRLSIKNTNAMKKIMTNKLALIPDISTLVPLQHSYSHTNTEHTSSTSNTNTHEHTQHTHSISHIEHQLQLNNVLSSPPLHPNDNIEIIQKDLTQENDATGNIDKDNDPL